MSKNQEYIESKIKKYSTDYIYYEAVGSFLLLLFSSVEEITEIPLAYKIPQEVLEIRKKISNYVLNLEDLLVKDNENLQRALEDCIDLKKKITAFYGNIYRYYANWNITSSGINDEVAIRKYREENVSSKKIEFDLFYTDCIEFLTSAQDITQQKSYMGQLLKCIPFHMTRNKYYDFIYDCLHLAFKEESEQAIKLSLDTFQQAIAPEAFPEYGKYFPEIAQWLSEKKELKPSLLSDEELEEEYSDFNSVFESLTKIEDIFSAIFNDLNSLIILFYLGFSFEELTEKNFIYTDLYHSVCELLSKEVEDAEITTFAERIRTLLEENIEPVIDQANFANKEEYRLLEKISDFKTLSPDTTKTLASETFVRANYYADINEELFNFNFDSDLPPASDTYKKEKFDEFITFIKNYFSPLPMQFRKISMQMLLCSLPPAYSIDDILELIRNAIEEAPSFEHKVLIIDKIGMVFTDNGFSYKTGEEKEIDHHCDCGHEHHHNCHCDHHHEE